MARRNPLPCVYRSNDRLDEHLRLAAEGPLREAGEALVLALLTLEGQDDPDRESGHQHRASQARSFLLEAVRALARARIYIPTIRTYTVPVIMAVDPDLDAELGRLHQIATRLQWYNHSFLPVRTAAPLRPEEEAQLAVMVRDLARTSRIDRALRHAWLGAALAVAVLAPTLGLVVVSLVLVTVLGAAAALQLGRAARPEPVAAPTD